MLYALSAIGGSLLTIAFFLGGVKANKNYDAIATKVTSLLNPQPDIQTTFIEPITPRESFTAAKTVDDLIH